MKTTNLFCISCYDKFRKSQIASTSCFCRLMCGSRHPRDRVLGLTLQGLLPILTSEYYALSRLMFKSKKLSLSAFSPKRMDKITISGQ